MFEFHHHFVVHLFPGSSCAIVTSCVYISCSCCFCELKSSWLWPSWMFPSSCFFMSELRASPSWPLPHLDFLLSLKIQTITPRNMITMMVIATPMSAYAPADSSLNFAAVVGVVWLDGLLGEKFEEVPAVVCGSCLEPGAADLGTRVI